MPAKLSKPVPPASDAGNSSAPTKKQQPRRKSPWALFPEKFCMQCEQGTHSLDFQSNHDKPVFLLWTKTKPNAKGVHAPAGCECYACYCVRRDYLDPVPSCKELKEQRSNKDTDTWFLERRAAKVTGDKQYKGETKAPIHSVVNKSKKKYKDDYEEGTFTPLPAFLEFRKIRFPPETTLGAIKKYIETKFPNSILRRDEDGVLGVEQLDQMAGQYRFKRGRKTSTGQKQSQKCVDDDDANTLFEQESGNLFGNFRTLGLSFASDMPAEQHHAVTHEDSPTRTNPYPHSLHPLQEDVPEDVPAADEDEEPCWAESAASEMSSPPPQRRARLSRKTDVSTSASGRAINAALAAEPEAAAPTTSPTGGKRPRSDGGKTDSSAPNKKKRRTQSQVVMDQAEAVFQAASDLTWQSQWENRQRTRDFKSLLDRIDLQVRKSGAILNNDAAVILSNKLFEIHGVLCNRQKMFERVKTTFWSSSWTTMRLRT